MKILVLDEWLPSIRNSGKSIRTFEILAPLAQKHEIVYLAHCDGSQQPKQVRNMEKAGFHVHCVPRYPVYSSPLSIALGIIPALFDPIPISVRRHFSQEYVHAMKKLVSDQTFSLVHFEWSHYGVYGKYVSRLPNFVCTHNIEYLSWKRLASTVRSPLKKLLGLHEAQKMLFFEKKTYRQADYLSVVSEDDARLIREGFGIENVCVIPNGVAISFYDDIANKPIANRLVYCGSMDAFVNQDAVAWFIKDIFPLILKEKPDATFCVIGRNPPRSLLKSQSDQVIFTGNIDDVRLPLQEGMIEVVPLRIAGGSRLKILEAFAAKVPVVSTNIGAEGLNISNGKNILLADTPESFAETCLLLLDDEEKRRSLAEQARQVVDEQYDWSRISPLVEQAWYRTIELAQARKKN